MTLEELVRTALEEDIGSGDWTTRCLIPDHQVGTAQVMAKSSGILSGAAPFVEVFRQLDQRVSVDWQFQEGEVLKPKDVVAQVQGPLTAILTAERTALNFLQRLSGIATLTQKFVEAVQGTRAVILDTRKTTPLLRDLEKAAVRHGGGANHRRGLYDMILIKDNHVSAAGGIRPAIELTQSALQVAGKVLPLEIEVKDLEELQEALKFSLNRILLDNFSLEMIAQAVKLADGRLPLEVSGGVNLENVRQIALTGVDYLSVGALTHSAPAFDFSLLSSP